MTVRKEVDIEVWSWYSLFALKHTYTHIHTHPSLLVRTIFPDPSCEDALLHSRYPNDTWAFISFFLGLLKHLIEITKRPIFLVGTLLWGP